MSFSVTASATPFKLCAMNLEFQACNFSRRFRRWLGDQRCARMLEIEPVDCNEALAEHSLSEHPGGVGLHAGEDVLVDAHREGRVMLLVSNTQAPSRRG
jgi:hypothetical protein